MTGLSANNLTCIKRDRVLFEDLSFALPRGQLMYLRGPNGAGKTSLLRILTGLTQPSAGEVLWNSRPLDKNWCTEMLYIGHKSGLNSAFTAIENLRFWCQQHGLSDSQDKIISTLEQFGLVGLEDMPVRYLSAGQQRRVALSRLNLKPAKVWLLDEPFTALDVDGVAQIETLMHAFVSNGGAVLTTSHQPLSALAGEVYYFDLEYQI